jgi:acyl dehydratase
MNPIRVPVFFEDLVVGRQHHCGEIIVTEPEALAFAARYDPQPFHLDAEAGRRSVFGGLAASGWLTAALTMRLMVTGGLDLGDGAVGLGIDSLQWPRPVFPGDTLMVTVEVLAVRGSASRPTCGVAKFRTTTTNQRSEVVQVMTSNVLVPRRPAANG